MNKLDKKEFAKMLMGTAELHDKELTKAVVEIYWRILSPFTIEEVDMAFALHASDVERGCFMPKPADLIRYVRGSSAEREGLAQLAWAKVLSEASAVGRYQNIWFSDPAIMYAIEVAFSSWEKFCISEESEHKFIIRDFIKAYMFYKPGLPVADVLYGVTSRVNQASGVNKDDKFISITCEYLNLENNETYFLTQDSLQNL